MSRKWQTGFTFERLNFGTEVPSGLQSCCLGPSVFGGVKKENCFCSSWISWVLSHIIQTLSSHVTAWMCVCRASVPFISCGGIDCPPCRSAWHWLDTFPLGLFPHCSQQQRQKDGSGKEFWTFCQRKKRFVIIISDAFFFNGGCSEWDR